MASKSLRPKRSIAAGVVSVLSIGLTAAVASEKAPDGLVSAVTTTNEKTGPSTETGTSPVPTPVPTPPPAPPRGAPVRVTVGPPATLGDWTTVLTGAGGVRTTDRAGLRTAVIGTGTVGKPAVAAVPGSAQTLGDERTTTIIDAGLERPADSASLQSPQAAAVGWLLSRAPTLLAASPTPAVEAAAVQVAAWQLTGATGPAPTADPATNLRAQDLVASASGRALASAITVTPPAKTCLDDITRVPLVGPPNGAVSLTATGPVVLLQPSVVLGATGAGVAQIRARRPGLIGVAASGSGEEIVRLNTLLPSGVQRGGSPTTGDEGLALLSLQPVPIKGSGASTAVDCGSTGSTEDAVTASTARAGAASGGSAPSRSVSRQSGVDFAPGPSTRRPVGVRGSAWVVVAASRAEDVDESTRALSIRVRNVGGRTARDLVVTARLPSGSRIVDRGAATVVSSGIVSWSVAKLRPGAAQTLVVTVRRGRSRLGIARRQITVRGRNVLAEWELPLADPVAP